MDGDVFTDLPERWSLCPGSRFRVSPRGSPIPILPSLGNQAPVTVKCDSPERLPSRRLNFGFDASVDLNVSLQPGPVWSLFISRSAPLSLPPLPHFPHLLCVCVYRGVGGVVCRENSEPII